MVRGPNERFLSHHVSYIVALLKDNSSCKFPYEKSDLHENELIDETHFHNNVFARRLVLKQRQRATQKCILISIILHSLGFFGGRGASGTYKGGRYEKGLHIPAFKVAELKAK